MVVPACGTSSPVSFALSARFSCRRPESAAAALVSPVSTAARNSANSGPRNGLQGLRHADAFLKQDAPGIALALQQLGRERRAHLGAQVRLPVPPNGIARDLEARRHRPL